MRQIEDFTDLIKRYSHFASVMPCLGARVDE